MSRHNPEIIVFFGPEGSGKTTVARRIAKAKHMKRVSTGDLLRHLAVHDPSEVGDACRKMFAENAYLDPSLLRKILTDRLREPDMEGGFVLDGGMRTVKETQEFREMLRDAGRDFPLTVVHLRIPGWKSIDRLSGVKRNGRKTDTPEGILSRLNKFYLGLPDRVRAIREQNGWNMVHVSAMGDIDATVEGVKTVIGIRPKRTRVA